MSAAAVRIGVTPNKGAKKPQAEGAGTLPRPVDFKQLAKFCKSKLKLKSGAARIFVCRGSPVKPAGFEILESISKEELNAILVDGVLLAVSAKGADYNDAGRATGDTLKQQLEVGREKLALPPRSLAIWLSRRARGNGAQHSREEKAAAEAVGEEGGTNDEGRTALSTCSDVIPVAITLPGQTAPERAGLSAVFADRAAVLVAQEQPAGSGAPPLKELEMSGLFPYFPRGASMLQVMRNACVASAGFVERFEAVQNTAGIVVFDYVGDPAPPEFPDPCQPGIGAETKLTHALQREARGLVLCAETGAVLARRFHKFFNLNERAEVCFPLGDASLAAGMCKEKLDGCLCSPVLVKGQLVWCTRRVRSAEVEDFAESEPDYGALARYFLGELNATPLFEWCPSTHVVGVLRHEKDRLVLLSVRLNSTGQYLDSAELDAFVAERFASVEQAKPLGAAGKLMRGQASGCRPVSDWTGSEGVVIAMESGARYKLKSDWYVGMARAAKQAGGIKNFLPTLLRNANGDKEEGVTLGNVPAEHLWLAVLTALESPDVLDDLVASCASELSEENGERRFFLEFVRLVQCGVGTLVQDFWAWAQDSFRSTGSADAVVAFAANWQPGAAWETSTPGPPSSQSSRPAVFAWPVDFTRAAVCCQSTAPGDSAAMRRSLRTLLVNLAKRGDVATIEGLLGVQWGVRDDQVLAGQTEYSHIPSDVVLTEQFGDLAACPDDSGIPEHVCEVYVPRKVAQLTGGKEDNTEAFLYLERTYRPAEGKIPGLWEQFKKMNIWDLRVDLQGMCRDGPTSHEGSPEHALLLVQFGRSAMIGQSNVNNSPKGNLAGVLVPTGFPVSCQHITEGLRRSFERQRVVLLQRRLGERETWSSWSSRALPPAAAKAEEGQQTELPSAALGNAGNPAWQLFCDLDGTLADFTAGVVQWTGKSPEEQPLSRMWAKLLSRPGFFEGLPWRRGAAGMWGEICDLMRRVEGDPGAASAVPQEGQSPKESADELEMGGAQTAPSDADEFNPPQNVAILTGVPSNAKKHVHKEKRKWCERHLQARGAAGTHKLRVVTCASREKNTHGGPRTILIDDAAERRKEWMAAGGVFIHHVSAERTLYELRRVLGLLGELPAVQEVREHVASGQQLASLAPLGCVACPSGSEADSRGIEVTIVTVEWPAILEPECAGRPTVVGIDCEWASRQDAKYSISLVQIAVSAVQVFVVDLLCASTRVKDELRRLCADRTVLKVGFALEGDVTRTQVDWRSVVDMQEAGRDLLFEGASAATWLKGSNLSFADLVTWMLGCETLDGGSNGQGLNKEKRLQHCNWEARPLSDEQVRYAALDAVLSLRMYEVLSARVGSAALPPKWMFHAKRAGTALAALQDVLKASGNAGYETAMEASLHDRTLLGGAADCAELCAVNEVICTAVFLAPSSKQQLLQRCPPLCSNVHADHVTLRSSADTEVDAEHLRSLPIGSEVNIEVDIGCVLVNSVDEPAIQALCVLALRTARTNVDLLPFVASGKPHVTLSAGAGVRPVASLDLMEWHSTSDSRLQLRGVVGLTARRPEADELAGLQPRVAQRIQQFCAGDWVIGDTLRFAPGELTSSDRKIVHEFAETHHLESRSEGWTEPAKRMILVKKRRHKEAGNDGVQGGAETAPAAGGLRIFKGGNEAIDEKADLLAGVGARRTRRVTDKSLLNLGEPAGTASGGSISTAAEPSVGCDSSGGALHGHVSPKGCGSRSDSLVKWDPAVVDGDPIAHADVIVLRGLPGAGKSTLSRWLCDAHGAIVCSADEFFERGAGLSAREVKKLVEQAEAHGSENPSVYQLVFSEVRLPDAHRCCRERFEEALTERASGDETSAGAATKRKIVLDNVNSRVAHYKKYVEAARRAALHVIILELVPSNSTDVSALSRRSLHGVPAAVSHCMHAAWEADARAYLLQPWVGGLPGACKAKQKVANEPAGGAYLAQDLLPSAVVKDLGGSNREYGDCTNLRDNDESGACSRAAFVAPADMSFQAWLSANHLFHFSTSRARTHLRMAVGTKPAMFLNVPTKLRAEFLQRYAQSCSEGERSYLVELVPTGSVHGTSGKEQIPVFRMFFDIDLPEVTEASSVIGNPLNLVGFVRLVQSTCGGGRVIVTGVSPQGRSGQRPGLHLRLPDTLVTQAQALELHAGVLNALRREPQANPLSAELAESVGNDWERVVDGAVYRTGAGLRMLGSRKVTKGVDRGRVHEVLYVVEADGKVSEGTPKQWSEVRLQEQCSMHVSD